jgi:hypothetical protein
VKLQLLKLKISLKAIGGVLLRPLYAIVGMVVTLAVLGMLLWIFNFDLFLYILTNSDISAGEKLTVFIQSYASLITNFENFAAIILVLFALLLGINMALLAFVMKNIGASIGKESGKSGLSLFAAVLGAGCAACGTSILAPVLTAVGSTATIGLVEAIGVTANFAGIGLVLFSITRLGSQAATIIAKSNQVS